MPLKFKVGKRKGCYELSKDLYVLSIQLMDDSHAPLQCTLSTESTGKDCLDYVAQRLEIKQTFYFGLRYKTKGMFYRWVELDKPLRKQLDKYGAKPQEQRLHFAVLYHTPDASLLTDDSSRYYYFLQMKNDIIEGRLLVTPEKAILLASYSLQVELGDHNEKSHTVESLQRFTLLPKHMTRSAQILEELIRQVVLGHKSLRGLPSTQAELLYIAETQHCEGYGEDYFQGRDEDGKEAFVGFCLEGIIVKRLEGVPIKYRWEEMWRITSHKRTFLINFAEVSAIPFTMEDCETCKYAAYVCNLQLAFFKEYLLKLRSKQKLDYSNGNRLPDFVPADTSFGKQSLSNGHKISPNGSPAVLLFSKQNGHHNGPDIIHRNLNGNGEVQFNGFTQDPPMQDPRRFSPLGNLRPFSYSTPHIQADYDMSQLSLNSHSSANDQMSFTGAVHHGPPNGHSETNGLLVPSTPPPYHPAPDYETALKQPSLDQYNDAVRRRQSTAMAEEMSKYGNGNDYGSPLIDNGAYIHSQSGSSYILMGTNGPLSDWNQGRSNPELNGNRAVGGAQGQPPLLRPAEVRTLASSTPDLSGKLLNSQMFGKQERRQRLDVTVENLSEIREMENGGNLRENDVKATINDDFSTYVSDTFTQTGVRQVEAESPEILEASTSVSHDSSLSNVDSARSCAGGRSANNGIRGFERYDPIMTTDFLCRTETAKLPDFNDKDLHNHSVIPCTSHTVVATTVHNGGLSVERPDLLQGSEGSDLTNDQRLADMESRLKAGCLNEELDKIPKKRVSAGVSTSQKSDNQRKNRFANILPYEDTRIMLRPHKNNPFGYINASNIQVPLGDSLVKYVATQGPMKETAEDFWQMIWETESKIIVMLTKSQEQGREKSFEYWPQEGERQTKLKFGDYQVSLQSSTESQTQVTCCLQLKHISTSQRRMVYHLQYLDWPAGGVPEFVDSFLGFLDEVSSVKRHLENETQRNLENSANRSRSQSRSSLFDISNQSTGSSKKNPTAPAGREQGAHSDATSPSLSLVNSSHTEPPPVVVHCCSGAGRTGVYILTELMIYCLEHNHNMEVSQMLALLRQQRMHLVQTSAQYKFVYTCLVEYLKNSRLI